MPPPRVIPLEFLDETYSAKTRGMGLPYGENFENLVGYNSVADNTGLFSFV